MDDAVEYCQATKRVWVSGEDGSSIGRFNMRAGIDIHTTVSEQMEGASECLYCTHGVPTYQDWLDFVSKIKEHYNIDVDSSFITEDCFNKSPRSKGGCT